MLGIGLHRCFLKIKRKLILSRSQALMTVLLKEVPVAWAQQEHKKMSKIIVQEFDVCHKFVEKFSRERKSVENTKKDIEST